MSVLFMAPASVHVRSNVLSHSATIPALRGACTHCGLLASYRSIGRLPPPSPPYPTPLHAQHRALGPSTALRACAGTTGPSTSAAGASSIFGNGSTLGVEGAAAGTSASAITDQARLPLPQTFVVPVPVGAGSET
ncbi:hypothetical protein K438DRAFT_1985818 [Mycena galopus ATCC 62051]|nr:hypothetical protein K438DRAFT_1985818 [Mycena galopus ATCC 62051]